MKRLFILVAFLTAAVIGGASSAQRVEANGNPQILTGVLQKIEKAHLDLRSLKAAIVQQRINSQIGSKDTDYGVLLYKPPVGNTKGKLRIDYNKPDIRVVSLIGENFIFYQPRINQVVKVSIAKASKGKTAGYTQIMGLDGSLRDLAKSYHIEYVKDESIQGQMTTQLHLVPKQNGQLASLDIWFSQQSWLPIQQKFIERNGDYSIVQLMNLEPNVKLNDDAFVVKYPSTTVVVDKI
jgi:outer membrane lipoprotein-sorting protein